MIAKVIVHDRDRTSAMRRMAALMGEVPRWWASPTNCGAAEGAVLASGVCRRRDRYRLHRAPSRRPRSLKPAPAGDRAFAVATLARLLEWLGRGPATAAGDPWSPWERAERIPAARRGPRGGALEGRRARRSPSIARRLPRRRPVGSTCRAALVEARRSARTTAGWRSGWASDTFYGGGGQRTAPTTDGIDYTTVHGRRQPTPAAGRSARRHAIRGDGLGRGGGRAHRCPARSSTCASRRATR